MPFCKVAQAVLFLRQKKDDSLAETFGKDEDGRFFGV
jgi:hypothetical protein